MPAETQEPFTAEDKEQGMHLPKVKRPQLHVYVCVGERCVMYL